MVNRHRLKEKYKRSFTVTKTKAVIGFLLSLIFSLILTPAFEKFAVYIYVPLKEKMFGASSEEHPQAEQTEEEPENQVDEEFQP